MTNQEVEAIKQGIQESASEARENALALHKQAHKSIESASGALDFINSLKALLPTLPDEVLMNPRFANVAPAFREFNEGATRLRKRMAQFDDIWTLFSVTTATAAVAVFTTIDSSPEQKYQIHLSLKILNNFSTGAVTQEKLRTQLFP